MLARSLDLTPDSDKPHTSQEFNFFRAPRVCRDPLRACRARSVAPREPQAQSLTSRAHRARVYPTIALLCFHACVGLNARVRAVRARARDVSSHTRVIFATCTHQFTIHLITNKLYQTHTHVRRSTAHWFPKVTGSCCTKRDVMLIPVCRATDTLPRRTTLLHAIPSRTDSRSTRPHIRDASRTRAPDVTSFRTDTNASFRNVRSSGWLHR